MFARSFLFVLCLVAIFLGLVVGHHGAVEEVVGKALADHSLDFFIGFATGAFGVGLLWWFRESWRK